MANSEITNGRGQPVYRIVSGKRGPVCTLCGDNRCDVTGEYIRFGSYGNTIGLACARAIAAALQAEPKSSGVADVPALDQSTEIQRRLAEARGAASAESINE